MPPLFSVSRALAPFLLHRLAATIVAALVISVCAAAPLDHARFAVRNWRVDEGLPDNTVNQIVQDDRGYLWFATTGGLARFDGTRFVEYPVPQLRRDGSASIRDLALEPDGTLVMLPATGGIFQYRDGAFSPHPASAGLADRSLLQIFAARDGALWIVPSGSDLIRWDRGVTRTFGTADGFSRRRSRVTFAADEQGRTWVGAADFLGYYEGGALHRGPDTVGQSIAIAPARAGGFWIATETQLLRMQGNTLHSILKSADWVHASNGLQDMFEDATGALWLASRRFGVSRVHAGTLDPVSTLHEGAIALADDGEGNIWVGTSGAGTDRIRAQPFIRLEAGDGLLDKVASSVGEDANGALWLADRRGGVVRMSATSGPYVVTAPNLHEEFFANVVYPAPDGAVWVGATQGIFHIPAGAAPQLHAVAPDLREVHVLFVSRAGDLWIGAGENTFGVLRGGAFHPLSSANGYTGHRVKAVVEDSQHHLIVATDDRQVFELTGEQLRPIITKEEMPGGLIAAAFIDPEDLLWLATSQGLVLRRKGKLHLFTTAQGLPDDVISQILADDHGRLWFGSRRGLFSVPRADLLAVADGRAARVDVVPLGRDEGLAGASALNNMQPMSWRGRDGRLWFTTFEGVVGVDPTASIPALPPPRIYLDRVQVNQADVPAAGRIHIGPGARQVAFAFSAINFSAPERVRLRHRLVGYDYDWIETGPDRRAVYSRLPPGEYRLEATAANAGGAWSPMIGLAVIVTPNWWQTWWARLAFAGLFTLAIAAAVRFWSVRRLRRRLERLEREHALEKERSRIARDLHDELGGSLTQIGMLADRVRRRAAESEVKSSLNQLSWRTRRLADELESIVWTVNPGNNTWEKLASFIDQYARGFCRDTALHCTVTGTEQIPALPLAPEAQHNVLSVVKEALNNILKHAHATEVQLRMSASDTAFELKITDNGIGFDPAAPEHTERNGLKNMRSRMSELSGAMEVRSVRGVGTEIVLRQPLTAATTRS